MAKSTYRKEFDYFLRTIPDDQHLPAMQEEFYLGPSERAAIILQASNVENLLERAIAHRLRKPLPSDLSDRLFEGRGPLSSFSEKILMGFALGIIGPHSRHDLEIIKDLRNAFAHVRLPMSFTTPEIAGMCTNLRVPDLPGSFGPQQYYDRFPDIKVAGDRTHPRTRFTKSCHAISLWLIEQCEADPPPLMNGLP